MKKQRGCTAGLLIVEVRLKTGNICFLHVWGISISQMAYCQKFGSLLCFVSSSWKKGSNIAILPFEEASRVEQIAPSSARSGYKPVVEGGGMLPGLTGGRGAQYTRQTNVEM